MTRAAILRVGKEAKGIKQGRMTVLRLGRGRQEICTPKEPYFSSSYCQNKHKFKNNLLKQKQEEEKKKRKKKKKTGEKTKKQQQKTTNKPTTTTATTTTKTTTTKEMGKKQQFLANDNGRIDVCLSIRTFLYQSQHPNIPFVTLYQLQKYWGS